MEYKVTKKKYKTCAWKNTTLYVYYSDSDSSDVKIFVNSDIQKSYTKIFSTKGINIERGLNFELE